MRVVVIDFETTGLRRKPTCHDRIWQVGAVIPGKAPLRLDINPTLPMYRWQLKAKEMALQKSVTAHHLNQQPQYPEAARKFLEWLEAQDGDAFLFVAHNAKFDCAMMTHWMAETHNSLNFKFADSLPLAKLLLPGLKRHKLDSVRVALFLCL